MNEAQKKKLGDVLCDIGKYISTAVPLSYFISDKPGALYVTIGTAFFGVLFVLFGLYFVKYSGSEAISNSKKKKRIKILKNTVFEVEEQSLANP